MNDFSVKYTDITFTESDLKEICNTRGGVKQIDIEPFPVKTLIGDGVCRRIEVCVVIPTEPLIRYGVKHNDKFLLDNQFIDGIRYFTLREITKV